MCRFLSVRSFMLCLQTRTDRYLGNFICVYCRLSFFLRVKAWFNIATVLITSIIQGTPSPFWILLDYVASFVTARLKIIGGSLHHSLPIWMCRSHRKVRWSWCHTRRGRPPWSTSRFRPRPPSPLRKGMICWRRLPPKGPASTSTPTLREPWRALKQNWIIYGEKIRNDTWTSWKRWICAQAM